MVDRLTPEKRSWNMSRITAKNTSPELLVRKFLHKNNFRYRLHKKSIPGKPDISNKSKKIAIFVNGCFWHRHGCKKTATPKSNIKFWEKKFRDNIDRDKRNYNLLKSLNWKVIVIWECEINEKTMKKKFSMMLQI